MDKLTFNAAFTFFQDDWTECTETEYYANLSTPDCIMSLAYGKDVWAVGTKRYTTCNGKFVVMQFFK